jgi:hypothetical protein
MKGGMPLIFLGIIPILALAAIIGGGGTLGYYCSLDEEEQEALNELALEIFAKTLEELSSNQSRLLKKRFFG